MAKDIVPELLEKLKSDFQKRYAGNARIKGVIERLQNGTATHIDSNIFAVEVGDLLAKTYVDNVSADMLPDRKMYYNIADRILNSTLGQSYELISSYAVDVQSLLNKQAGLNIKGIKPPINQSRIDGLIEKVSEEDDFDKVAWVLDEPVKNFNQAVVDDTIKSNTEFHHKLGLKPKIIRKTAGHCCDWCNKIAGAYDYPDVPKDIYRRHRFCRCTVEYNPGDGRKQNVHTKKWADPQLPEKIENRKSANVEIKDINRKDDSEQYKKYIDILGKENMPESLSKFQDLKYNDIEKYERLKDKAYIQNNFNRGIWKDEINPEKQARHIKSTAGKTKSYFYDDIDIEALYNKYKMTGYIQPYGNGVNSSDEKVDLYEANPVGIDIFTGNVVNAMTIKYGKTGSHLIPTYYERGK